MASKKYVYILKINVIYCYILSMDDTNYTYHVEWNVLRLPEILLGVVVEQWPDNWGKIPVPILINYCSPIIYQITQQKFKLEEKTYIHSSPLWMNF